MKMRSFEQQIEEETNERIEAACAIEREITARRCAEIAMERDAKCSYDSAGAACRLVAKDILKEFGITTDSSASSHS